MAVRRVLQTRRFQPTDIAGLNLNHPLAPYVQSIWTPAGVILRDGAFVAQSPGTPVAGPFGLGHAFNGSNQQILMPTNSLVHTEGSRVVLARIGSGSGIRHFSAGGGSSIGFRTNGLALELTRAFVNTSITVANAVTAGEYAVLGCSFTIGGVPGGLGRGLFKNGNSIFTSTQGVGSADNTYTDALMSSGVNSQYGDHTLFAHFSFNKSLSAAEHADMASNPWELFEPQRIFVPMSVASAPASLYPPLLTNSQVFPSPAVAAGPRTLAPTRLANTQAFFAPTVNRSGVALQPTPFVNTQVFFAPTVGRSSIALRPALLTNAQTFYAPSVSSTGVSLQPPTITNEQVFYAPSVGVSGKTLTAPLLTNEQVFYPALVSGSGVFVQPPLLTNEQVFYPALVSGSGLFVQPPLLQNEQTFYEATLAVGVVNLLASLFTNESEFYGPLVGNGELVALPPLLVNESEFFEASVTPGPVQLTATLFVNENTFYAPSLDDSTTIAPSLFVNYQSFLPPAVTVGRITLTPSLLTGTQVFYSPIVGEHVVVPVIGVSRTRRVNAAPVPRTVRMTSPKREVLAQKIVRRIVL